jgi:2'-5' RNA ligase
MPVIRAFIAINLSPEIARKLESILIDLQRKLKGVPVRWVPVDNIHITLKFLGDVSVSNLDMLKKIIAAEAARHTSFEISARDLGAYPSLKRARVIWVDVKAPPDLASFQRALDQETARLGYPGEDRPFSPHLTLGRVSRNASSDDLHRISTVLAETKPGVLGTALINSVYLYRSDLLPSGAVYSALFNSELGPKNPS